MAASRKNQAPALAGENSYNSRMICLDAYLNGEKLCRAGIEDVRVLNGMLNYVKLKDGSEEIRLEVGGLYRHVSDVSVHPRWVQQLHIKKGDEITMRFVDADDADEPVEHEVSTREWIEQQEREYYERMKEKFDPE